MFIFQVFQMINFLFSKFFLFGLKNIIINKIKDAI